MVVQPGRETALQADLMLASVAHCVPFATARDNSGSITPRVLRCFVSTQLALECFFHNGSVAE